MDLHDFSLVVFCVPVVQIKKILWTVLSVQKKSLKFLAHPGAVKDHPGAVEAHPGAVEALPGAVKVHPGVGSSDFLS